MGIFNSFKTNKNKISKLWNKAETNKINSERIEKQQVISYPVNIIKKTTEINLSFETVYYDLYDWLGITSQYGGSAPEPESAYTKVPDRDIWFFKYPVQDFRVPQGEKPWNITGTSSENWEYKKTIGNIKQSYHFDLFPDWAIQYAKIKSYVYSEDDEGTPVVVEDLSIFHRWIKKENGYDFEFYGFFTLPEEQELLLYVSLVMLNRRVMDAIQGKQI